MSDPQSRVGVRVQRSRARGTAVGGGNGPLKLENMLRTEDVEDGDLIITSGTDGVYPAGAGGGAGDEPGEEGARHVPARGHRPRGGHHRLEEVLVVGSPYAPWRRAARRSEGTR